MVLEVEGYVVGDVPTRWARATGLVRRRWGIIGVLIAVALAFISSQLLKAESAQIPLTLQTSPGASVTSAPSTMPSDTGSPSPLGGTSSAKPSAAALVVHVVGLVSRPGVYSLPAGSRVNDAVRAAGGVTAPGQVGELNLAAPLSDGAQVIIGPYRGLGSQMRSSGEAVTIPGSPGAGRSSSASSTAATIDLNTATAEQLETLPGVGPVTAQNILRWRSEHGRFTSVSELQEVDGIGPKTYAQLAPHVRV